MWTFSAIHCSLEMESEQDKHANLVLLISDDKMAKGWAAHRDELHEHILKGIRKILQRISVQDYRILI